MTMTKSLIIRSVNSVRCGTINRHLKYKSRKDTMAMQRILYGSSIWTLDKKEESDYKYQK